MRIHENPYPLTHVVPQIHTYLHASTPRPPLPTHIHLFPQIHTYLHAPPAPTPHTHTHPSTDTHLSTCIPHPHSPHTYTSIHRYTPIYMHPPPPLPTHIHIHPQIHTYLHAPPTPTPHTHTHPSTDTYLSTCIPTPTHRRAGLVVKASASEAEDPGFESRWRRDFSGSSHTSDLNIGTPVATLPGAWHYRVIAGTGRPGASIL